MRRVANNYAQYYIDRGVNISQDLAEAQFDAYAAALGDAGLQVHFVEADERFPDCVFVEDPAVVWAPRALIARMAPHREGEQPPVEEKLKHWHEIAYLPPGALLEGGDVLHAGEVTYVGLTERTNEAGIEALREFMSPFGRRVIRVRVDKYLHLKSAVTYLGNGTIVAAPDHIDIRSFEVERVIFTDRDEIGANCLRVGNHLLIPTGYPSTERRLRSFAEENGVEVIPLNISEFEKGDGSITCLCIVW